MIDPISATELSIEGAAICVAAIKKLKRFVESTRNAGKEMQDLLERTNRIRSVLELLRVAVIELQGTEFKDLQIAINDGNCQLLLREVLTLANSIVSDGTNLSIRERLMWAKKASEAQSLVRKIGEQEAEITQALIIINTASSLRIQQQTKSLTERFKERLTVEPAFHEVLVDDKSAILRVEKAEHSSQDLLIKTWVGRMISDGESDHYLHWRTALSDACYWGKWSQIWDILDTARAEYHENWVNAPRMKTAAESQFMSFWTPLHQAVYTGASMEVIDGLLERGASRTLRTRWSAYSYRDLSPLDLAREIGASSLFEVLAPVIHNPVPWEVLKTLEHSFHSIIRNDLGARVDDEKLYLPNLEVLTELKEEPMWFPIRVQGQRYAGYVYQLDGRELVVRSFYIGKPDEIKTYRVTKDEVFEIEEAVLLG